MASSQPPALTAGDRTLLFLLLLLVTARFSSAQSPPSSSSSNSNNSPYLSNPNFNPSMAIVIVVLISAFFFLGFFSIYIRQCAGDRRGSEASNAPRNRGANARSRRQRGLDPAILATFPTLVYSDVRDHKLGKGSLECAVCLSEFDDDESLRLLPRCDHVFHPDCIDAWLAAHVTCPVCRCNLEEPPADPQPEIGQIDPNPTQEPEPARPEPEPQQVAIQVGPAEEDEERKAEIENLEKFVNTKRARSRARPARFPRSHSTGHSLVMPGENLDRFTLRLPTNIRKEIVERAEMMQRAKSLGVYPAEGSSRRGGGGGGGRSIQLGRSDRWGSFLMRTLSMKMTNWGRRGDGDGSSLIRGSSSIRGGFFRRGDSIKGEGSTKGGGVKFNAFDCYGGAATKSEESQSSAFNRV